MSSKAIVVGMADLNVTRHPGVLTTLGLGSCVGIALYDRHNKIAGLAHIMLPNSKQISNSSNIFKFADTATLNLISRMNRMGAHREHIVAKIAGGAQMFAFDSTNSALRIGDRNVEAVIEILKELAIPIIGRDTGCTYGRTIELYAEDGRLVVKTIAHGTKII